MARQDSIIKLNGVIDDISFFKTKDGYQARKKTGITKAEMEGNPRFERTRENMAEFSRAAKAAKYLRDALLESTVGARDRKMAGRLVKSMMQVIHADATSTRGKRNVLDGETELLQGFEFNEAGPLTATLLATYHASIDRHTGICKVSLPPYSPSKMIKNAAGATHYKIGLTAAVIDFETPDKQVVNTVSDYLPVTGSETSLLELTAMLAPELLHPVFLTLRIEFVQELNGNKYALKGGEFNACALVKVDGGA